MDDVKKLIILLDLDDVLNNQGELWVEDLRNIYGCDVGYEDIIEWNISKFYPELSEKQIYSPALNPSMVLRMSPQRDSVHYTSEWHKRGHTILITTATSVGTADAKARWLKRHYPWFTQQNLIIAHKKQLIKGDILIDDGIHNLLPDKETGIQPTYTKVCFERPWNKNFDCGRYGIHRVKNFSEIDGIIRELEIIKEDLK